jgi:hypothetical protein
VNLRSLALMLFIFGASAALAGYVGMRYEEPVASKHQVAAPTKAPAPVQPAPSAAVAPSPPQLETSVVPPTPAPEATRPQTLQSAAESKVPQEAQPPAKNTMQLSGSSTADATRTTGAREIEAPKCNKDACATAYRSFDAGDCTYQPSNGPRRICKK